MGKRVVVVVLAVTLVALVVLEPTMAMAAGTQAGQKTGKMLNGWGKALFGGIAGLIGLFLLMGRKITQLMVFAGAALIVGMFIMAPASILSAAGDIARGILS